MYPAVSGVVPGVIPGVVPGAIPGVVPGVKNFRKHGSLFHESKITFPSAITPIKTPFSTRSIAAHAKARQRKGGMGFVEEDNSGKANIFAVEPKTLYTSSPRADREARKGLGGAQGLGVVLGVAVAVAVATIGTKNDGI